MYEVDARGLSCPEPLILVSEALKSHPGEQIKVLEQRTYRTGKRNWFGVRTDDRRTEIDEAERK